MRGGNPASPAPKTMKTKTHKQTSRNTPHWLQRGVRRIGVMARLAHLAKSMDAVYQARQRDLGNAFQVLAKHQQVARFCKHHTSQESKSPRNLPNVELNLTIPAASLAPLREVLQSLATRSQESALKTPTLVFRCSYTPNVPHKPSGD